MRGGFELSAGSLCLDFVGTLDREGDTVVDRLPTPRALAEWFAVPGLPVPAGGLTDADLTDAHTLRAAIDAVARALVHRATPKPDDVRCINAFAQRPTPVYLLRPSARQRVVVEQVDASGSLSVLARDAIHLFAEADPSRLRECAREVCATLFYDRSPAGQRRWCAMKGCGEIVASASYRRRRAANDGAVPAKSRKDNA